MNNEDENENKPNQGNKGILKINRIKVQFT